MRSSEIGRMKCPVARTLSIVGDPWTLLILRELFLRSHRFEEFQGYTGMAPYLLTTRLKRLVKDGIIERHAYQQRPRRYEYRLTDKGLDLYPVVVAMSQWGNRWMSDASGPPLKLTHGHCGAHSTPVLHCSECGEAVGPRDMRTEMQPVMLRDRERMWNRFKRRTARH